MYAWDGRPAEHAGEAQIPRSKRELQDPFQYLGFAQMLTISELRTKGPLVKPNLPYSGRHNLGSSCFYTPRLKANMYVYLSPEMDMVLSTPFF